MWGMCMAPTLVCNTDTNMCVECVRSTDCAATTPVCDQHACRACKAHDECELSQTCLPDGSCAAASEVAYIANPGGSDNPTCDKAMPCATMMAALATMKPNIKIDGLLDESRTIDATTVTIVGTPMARWTSTGAGNGSVITVSGSSTITIADLAIGSGTSISNNGITLNSGTLTLENVTVEGCDTNGIALKSG